MNKHVCVVETRFFYKNLWSKHPFVCMAQQLENQGGGYNPFDAINNEQKNDDGLQYQWQIDLNFDVDQDQIVMKVTEKLSKRKWSKRFSKEDVDGDIRKEYQKMGEAISAGTQDYVYPKDSGAVKCTITYENHAVTYSLPQDY